jgi:hypothetical protein
MRLFLALGIIVLLAAGSPAGQEYEATPPLAADTLRYELTAGESLVVSLPGPDDAEFRGVRLPALSWIVDRSFGWRTLPGEEGREYVVILRRTETRTDTLVLVVDVLR